MQTEQYRLTLVDKPPVPHGIPPVVGMMPEGVDSLPPDIVTLRTRVLVEEADGASRRELTLCYPAEANAAAGFISVLSPLGMALLGERVGARTYWRSPDGTERSLTVVAILFQPEASGAYTL